MHHQAHTNHDHKHNVRPTWAERKAARRYFHTLGPLAAGLLGKERPLVAGADVDSEPDAAP
eukprot:3836935-Pyramimonas_sp.AAC.1